jgi:hypothetical protein
MLGMAAAIDQMYAQVALGDRPGLAYLAAIEPHEVRNLRVETAGVDLTRRERAVEERRDLAEVRLHRRGGHCGSPPKTSTFVNTQAGAACPTRITCEGSPLPAVRR